MARTREFDTDAAITAIAERFWADGYEETGIADLVEATGVGRQSLYGAFGSKRDMLLIAIDQYLAASIEPMMKPLREGSIEAVELMFSRFAVAFDTMPERVRLGCMMVNTSTAGISTDPAVEERAADYREGFRSAFHGALIRAVEAGEIEGPVDARADQLTLMLVGMFVAIRSGADRVEVTRLSGAVVSQVEAWRIDR